MTPLSGRVVLAVALSVVLLTAAVVVGLLWWAGGAGLAGAELATARFDALKIGLSIGVGGGGVFALYLAWRRQRSTEQTMIHTEEDARERRITELYTKAVEQLGSGKAPVRLGGLYALERLAQNNPDQRQTIVNVMCAYLRMRMLAEKSERTQEREVRRTAQRILAMHLRAGPSFWPAIDLDLSEAVLDEFDMAGCKVNNANFFCTEFDEEADFRLSVFDGKTNFVGAVFTGDALFDEARFRDTAWFGGVTFRVLSCDAARFDGQTDFAEAMLNLSVRPPGVPPVFASPPSTPAGSVPDRVSEGL